MDLRYVRQVAGGWHRLCFLMTKGCPMLASDASSLDPMNERRSVATVESGTMATLDGSVAAPAAGSLTVRSRIGRFVLLRQIGEGGMGVVFAAYDEDLDRKVAIKLLSKPKVSSQLQRTLQEARALARVSHPNVVSIYEVGQSDDRVYIAMEYVDGGTLSAWQTQQPRSWQQILSMYLLVGQGLSAAHRAGIVHRDFKPENVLIGQDGRPRVADFGIARLHSAPLAMAHEDADGAGGPSSAESPRGMDSKESVRLTLPGVISGTPGYMSPEQYRGGDVDARSDQFAFCAALFEALYGKLPFPGETLAELAESVHGPVEKRPPQSPIPEEIYQTLLTGLAVDKAQRFASMDELLFRLALEDSDHAGAASLSLRQFAQVSMGIVMLLVLFVQSRTAQRALTYKQMLTISTVLIGVAVIGGLFKRKTLLANQFHRRLWILFTSFVVLNFGQRLLGFVFKTPLIQLVPFELLAMAANIAVAAAMALPALFWVPILLVAAAAATVVAPEAMRPILSAPYVVGCFSSLIAWLHYSGKAKRDVAGYGGS